jgi:hypothetical protein
MPGEPLCRLLNSSDQRDGRVPRFLAGNVAPLITCDKDSEVREFERSADLTTCFCVSETGLPLGYTKSHRPRAVAFVVSRPMAATCCDARGKPGVSLGRLNATFIGLRRGAQTPSFNAKVSVVSESLLAVG